MREDNQVRQVLNIIESFDFSMPLGRFLAEHYKANKQMGGRDRRLASQLIFSYFRLGRACSKQSVEERLALGYLLCSETNTSLSAYFREKYNLPLIEEGASLEVKFEKLQTIYSTLMNEVVFPFTAALSEGVDAQEFGRSFFKQPRFFIRTRRKFRQEVLKDLKKNQIEFSEVTGTPNALAFENTVGITMLDTFKKGYFEIQDLSSQKTGNFYNAAENEYWWDCCAASGGKSLLLTDAVPRIKLLVSDIRASILENLKERFARVQFKNYTAQLLDLSNGFDLKEGPFDGIILDAPCSGSGTWARCPEMVQHFDENEIQRFSNLQQTIATAVLPYLKQGKPLIYSTCSVFRDENEKVVEFLVNNHGVKLEQMELVSGLSDGADTMFVARLIKL